MFPRFRQHLLARADLLLELSTLGEYGLDESGAVIEIEQKSSIPHRATRRRGCDGEQMAPPLCATAAGRVSPARP